MSDEPLIAVFVDFENLGIGVRHMKAGPFQIQLILKRLLEKGRIVFKRAYCDCASAVSDRAAGRRIIQISSKSAGTVTTLVSKKNFTQPSESASTPLVEANIVRGTAENEDSSAYCVAVKPGEHRLDR